MLPEALRIKAFLCLDRNATRDYLDLAALTAHIGIDAAVDALWPMDALYPQRNGDPWIVRTQLVMQFAAPRPYDLERVDLTEYRGIRPPFDHWSHVVEICGTLSDVLLAACLNRLNTDKSDLGPSGDGSAPQLASCVRERIDDAAASFAWAQIMKHRHLQGERWSIAAIEDLLARGKL